MQYVAYNKNTLYHAMFKMHAKKKYNLKNKIKNVRDINT